VEARHADQSIAARPVHGFRMYANRSCSGVIGSIAMSSEHTPPGLDDGVDLTFEAPDCPFVYRAPFIDDFDVIIARMEIELRCKLFGSRLISKPASRNATAPASLSVSGKPPLNMTNAINFIVVLLVF
jgi:hypothetical protein